MTLAHHFFWDTIYSWCVGDLLAELLIRFWWVLSIWT